MKSRTTKTNGVKELLIGARRHGGIIGEIARFDRLIPGGVAVAFAVFPMARKTIGQVEFFPIGVVATRRQSRGSPYQEHSTEHDVCYQRRHRIAAPHHVSFRTGPLVLSRLIVSGS